MKIAMRVIMIVVVVFSAIGSGLLIGEMLHYFYLDSIATVSSQHFQAYTGTTITANATVQFNSSGEYGEFCFIKSQDGHELCSSPAPRPDNPKAQSLKSAFTPGTWVVKNTEERITIQSEQNLNHCNNNKRGFIGMCIMFGIMYLALLGIGIHGIKIVFSKDATY